MLSGLSFAQKAHRQIQSATGRIRRGEPGAASQDFESSAVITVESAIQMAWRSK